MSVDFTYNADHEPRHVLFTPQTKEELQSEIVRFRSGLLTNGLFYNAFHLLQTLNCICLS